MRGQTVARRHRAPWSSKTHSGKPDPLLVGGALVPPDGSEAEPSFSPSFSTTGVDAPDAPAFGGLGVEDPDAPALDF